MRHQTHARRLDGGGNLYSVREPQPGTSPYAGGAMRNIRGQVDYAPHGR